ELFIPILSGAKPQRILPELSRVKIRLGATDSTSISGCWLTAAWFNPLKHSREKKPALTSVLLTKDKGIISIVLDISCRYGRWYFADAPHHHSLLGYWPRKRTILCLIACCRIPG